MTDDREPTPAADPASVPDSEPAPVPSAEPGRRDHVTPARRRRRRWPWIVLVVAALVVAVAARWNLDSFAIQPGSAQSVQQFIKVPPDRGHPVFHPVLLTDVQIGRVTALSYLFYKLQGDTSFVPVDEVTGGTPPSQLDAQGALQMSQAENAAKTAALRHLGYSVVATAAGAVITGTYPGTPAFPVLHVGDVVTAVDGTPTPTASALTSTLHHFHSGDTVTLSVRRSRTAPTSSVTVTLRSTKVDVGGGQTVTVDLGIQSADQVDYTYPFPVNIDVADIGGPSAGLAMTLGVIDALTNGSLTGKRTVAATGTIDSQGDVGDVGGVPQKTVAVENAGASIFLVPPPEYREALSKDRPGLAIFAVSTLDQALRVLAAHGGSVPGPTPSGARGGSG